MELAYKELKLLIPDSVYPPAEDSFMLAGAAAELEGHILEIGCGCGIVSLSCKKASSVLGVDINPHAVTCAKENAKRNNISNVTFVESDLFSDAKGKFDAILFNPPYLPTEKDEKLKGDLNKAFDGGKDGRKVLDRFLEEFDKYLNPGGTLFLIQSSLNDLEKTKAALERLGYTIKIQEQEDFFFEKLFLLNATKN